MSKKYGLTYMKKRKINPRCLLSDISDLSDDSSDSDNVSLKRQSIKISATAIARNYVADVKERLKRKNEANKANESNDKVNNDLTLKATSTPFFSTNAAFNRTAISPIQFASTRKHSLKRLATAENTAKQLFLTNEKATHDPVATEDFNLLESSSNEEAPQNILTSLNLSPRVVLDRIEIKPLEIDKVPNKINILQHNIVYPKVVSPSKISRVSPIKRKADVVIEPQSPNKSSKIEIVEDSRRSERLSRKSPFQLVATTSVYNDTQLPNKSSKIKILEESKQSARLSRKSQFQLVETTSDHLEIDALITSDIINEIGIPKTNPTSSTFSENRDDNDDDNNNDNNNQRGNETASKTSNQRKSTNKTNFEAPIPKRGRGRPKKKTNSEASAAVKKVAPAKADKKVAPEKADKKVAPAKADKKVATTKADKKQTQKKQRQKELQEGEDVMVYLEKNEASVTCSEITSSSGRPVRNRRPPPTQLRYMCYIVRYTSSAKAIEQQISSTKNTDSEVISSSTNDTVNNKGKKKKIPVKKSTEEKKKTKRNRDESFDRLKSIEEDINDEIPLDQEDKERSQKNTSILDPTLDNVAAFEEDVPCCSKELDEFIKPLPMPRPNKKLKKIKPSKPLSVVLDSGYDTTDTPMKASVDAPGDGCQTPDNKAHSSNAPNSCMRQKTSNKSKIVSFAINERTSHNKTFDAADDKYLLLLNKQGSFDAVKWVFGEKPKASTNISVLSQLKLGQSQVGSILIPPGICKSAAIPKTSSMIFFMVEGECNVTVINRTKIIKSPEFFIVPVGAEYLIKNVSSSQAALLHYVRQPDSG